MGNTSSAMHDIALCHTCSVISHPAITGTQPGDQLQTQTTLIDSDVVRLLQHCAIATNRGT